MSSAIPDFNDRARLLLLQYKVNKSWKDKADLAKLEKIYPDHRSYENELIKVLGELKMLQYFHVVHKDADINGFPQADDMTYAALETTLEGEHALRSPRFPSEYKARKRRYYGMWVPIWISIGALIPALYSMYISIRNEKQISTIKTQVGNMKGASSHSNAHNQLKYKATNTTDSTRVPNDQSKISKSNIDQ